jgi:hypothetical protein
MKKALSGLVVIVVGVLLALAAVAAWAERGERAREQVILRDLLEEFRANEARLLADIETNVGSQAAGEAWAAAMYGVDTITSDSLASLFHTSHFGARFDPITGTIRSVIDGGELGIIRDDELRAALAGWLDRAEEARLTDQQVTDMRAALAPALLALEPGGTLSPGEFSAIQYETALADGNVQLIPLLQDLRRLATLLESQQAR